MARNLRSLLISVLALRHGRNQKQLGAAAGMAQKEVSRYLRQEEMEDDIYERLLAGTKCRPAEIPIVMACLESLDFLENGQELTPEEREEVETGVLAVTRLIREVLTEAARQSRTCSRAQKRAGSPARAAHQRSPGHSVTSKMGSSAVGENPLPRRWERGPPDALYLSLEEGMSDWIVADPEIFAGKPCIKGTRISVEFILELLASGATREEILRAYPQIPTEGLTAALQYAARTMKNEVVWEIPIPA